MHRLKKLVTLTLLSLSVLSYLSLSSLAGAASSTSLSRPKPVDPAQIEAIRQDSRLLIELKQRLAELQYRHLLLISNVEYSKESLEEVKDTINELDTEVDDLDAQIRDKRKQKYSVKSQKEEQNMALEDLIKEASELEDQIEEQKLVVAELLSLLYVKRDFYYDDENINTVKLLASPDSVSETLQRISYIDTVEVQASVQMDFLAELRKSLDKKRAEIAIKQDQLDKVDVRVSSELDELILKRNERAQLLEEIQSEEKMLSLMLSGSDKKEDELLSEIDVYRKNIKSLEEKLDSVTDLIPEEERQIIEQIETELEADFNIDTAADFLELDWPVSPKAGLTAFFSDSAYQEHFGVPHNALDIRANQGTPIKAPADGVVTNVIFDPESTKYAFVVVAHRMGVASLYGHVSEVNVKIGDFVKRGDVIAHTGAMPGSIGSGVRTTGPHLHMEVFQDGVRVDPLLYLPLSEVPTDSLPESYKEKLASDVQKRLDEVKKALGVQ